MSLRIRRGTEIQRANATVAEGEIVWAADTKKLYVGDGSALGGVNVLATSVDGSHGIEWHPASQTLRFNGSGTGIVSVSSDLTPSLGGNLNLAGRSISGTGSITLNPGTVTATQFIGAVAATAITASGNVNITGDVTSPNINTYNIKSATNSLNVINSNLSVLTIQGLTDGLASGVSGIEIHNSRGTIASPLTTQINDIVGRITLSGWNGTDNRSAVTLYAQWAAGAVLSDVTPASNIIFSVGAGGSATKTALFTSGGVFSAPVLKTGSYNGSANYPPIPANPLTAAGVIIFDSSNGHFYGYSGSVWKQLDN